MDLYQVAYIITQKGLLKPEELLKGIGLIEVDFDNLVMDMRMDSIYNIVSGVETVVKAKRNKDVKFCEIDMLRHIAYRNTVENLFIRHGMKENIMELTKEDMIQIAEIHGVKVELDSNEPHQIWNETIGEYRDLTKDDIYTLFKENK